MPSQIHTGPDIDEPVVLGKTLTSLMYEACSKYGDGNCPNAFNQPTGDGWQAYSLADFREQSEEIALGLRGLGLERGSHVGLFMESDVFFCMADMGCLIGGLIDVPIYLTHADASVKYVLRHSECQAVFVSSPKELRTLAPILADVPDVRYVIVAEDYEDASVPDVPERVQVLTLDALRARGRERREERSIEKLLVTIQPEDVATLIYTSGTTGQPKGVILTHENISFNAMSAFGGLKTDYEPGPKGEVALSFLPLTHIFARALHYGYMAHATPVYFTSSDNLADSLKKVRPTILASVPRVLEKVYGNIKRRAETLSPVKKRLLEWSLRLAETYEVGKQPSAAFRAQKLILNPLVYKKWREGLGGRMRYLVVGGAPLSARLTNIFAAAGITALQGYGLTETSPIITYNRPRRNRAGTTGEPMAGVEVQIADDGEILTRGPHVMQGYYKEEEQTRESITDEGWFHTGDVGEFTSEGFLKITDRKKDLFKLSTGKYVMPQPLESRLGAEPLIEQAIVVGSGRKYTSALIFPNQEALEESEGGTDIEAMLEDPEVIERFQDMVDKANEGMDPWSQIKRFTLIAAELTPENQMLTPSLKARRSKVQEKYQDAIDQMYNRGKRSQETAA